MTENAQEAKKQNRRITVPPGAMLILPLRQSVLFPSTVMPLVVGRAASLQAVEEAVRQQIQVGFVAQRNPTIELPSPENLFAVGTSADVLPLCSVLRPRPIRCAT